MSLAVFELNDSAIGHGSSPEQWNESPGYALLNDKGITTGETARQSAWLQPQQSFHKYWHQLNLSPLSHQTSFARHHADLAFAQLQQLYLDSGEPEQVIFAVPGNFTHEQLSLLLGLVKASPFEAIGLVDNALAASATQANSVTQGPVLHLDIQMHQCVITRLEFDSASQSIQRIATETLNDLGQRTLLDSWAQFIGELFIQSYRYDPLHTASGEQQLFDQLPGWLDQLNRNSQITASLDTRKGNFRLNVLKDQLLASSESRIQQLQKGVAKLRTANEPILLSHRFARLPGLTELFDNAVTLAPDASLSGCLQNVEAIRSNPEALSFVTRLPLAEVSVSSTPTEPTAAETPPEVSTESVPTHALIGHRAVAIGEQQAFAIGNQGIEPCDNSDQAAFQIALNRAGLVCQVSDGFEVEAPDNLTVGTVIKAGDNKLTLIEVI